MQEVSICLRDIDSIVTLKINPQSSIASQASTLSGNNLRVVSFDEHMWPSVSIDKLAKHYARLAKLKLSCELCTILCSHIVIIYRRRC